MSTNYCPHCHLTGALDTANRCNFCGRAAGDTVPAPDPPPTAPAMFGWECPRCHMVHSPFVQQCWCPPSTWVLSSGDTGGESHLFV